MRPSHSAVVTFGTLLILALPQRAHPQGAGAGEIRGRIVDAATGTGVGVGSAAALRASDSTIVAGALPDSAGVFHIRRLAPGAYLLRVRVLGFAPVVRAGVVISSDHLVADLGNVALSPVAVQLGAQQVTAERPDVTFAPDRNIYSTKNMATTSGGTAVDVLRNVPSVEVDASNQVSLRGNQSVVVQINGRPSPLKAGPARKLSRTASGEHGEERRGVHEPVREE